MTHHIDVHIGQRIRRRRWMIGITQRQLANAVGINFQQIQKYETGANRVPASRLFAISQVLSVSISYFFERTNYATEDAVLEHAEIAIPTDLFEGQEAHELLRCYLRSPEEQHERLFALTRSISDMDAA